MSDRTGPDVFVSYSHQDNTIPEGSLAKLGWVGALANNLNVGPGALKKDLYIDYRLKPGDAFSDDLISTVESSALLLLLLSQNYVDSAWCGKELDRFVRANGNDPAKPPDVFVVELCPFDDFERVPENILSLRKRRIHAKFWVKNIDASVPTVAGYPTPEESGEAGHYWRSLNELQVAIDSRLRAHRTERARNAVAAPRNVIEQPSQDGTRPPRLGGVLLADVTDDLEIHRAAVKIALEKEGISVLPDGDYVGLTPEEFKTAFTADMANSSLFIQLLSATVGRKGRGFAAPLAQLQYEVARAGGKAMMQWCERLPLHARIADPAHARLFETEFLRATNLANFKAEVIDRMRREAESLKRAAGGAVPGAAGVPRGKVVFVDDFAAEPGLKGRLQETIEAQGWYIRRPPPAAPLGNNGISVKDMLWPCRAGLTIFTDEAKFVTAYNRLTFFLKQIAEFELPITRWGIYLEKGDVASVFGIESRDVVAVSEPSLPDFLRQV